MSVEPRRPGQVRGDLIDSGTSEPLHECPNCLCANPVSVDGRCPECGRFV